MGLSAFQRRRRELAAALAQEKENQAEQTVEKPLDEMTVAELKEYAEQHGIDLGEAKKKVEILTVIHAAVSDSEQANGDPGGGEGDEQADGEGGGDHAGD